MSRTPSLLTTIVQAGAGTGKTESLAQRIIDLAEVIYEQKGRAPRFVATTFTERATSELRERVVSLLARREIIAPWLADFVQDTQDLYISTIHGTLSLILHRFGSLLGLDPEFTILTQGEENEILVRVIRDSLAQNPQWGVLLEHYSFAELVQSVKKLNSHKRLHGERFKTAEGWKNLFEKEKCAFLDSLALLEAVDTASFPPSLAEKVQTLQSLHRQFKSADKNFGEIREIFLSVVGEMRKPSIKAGGRGSEIAPALETIFSFKKRNNKEYWGSDAFDPVVNERHDQVCRLVNELVESSVKTLREFKNNEGVLTFDDLEFLALELVEKHPEALRSIRQDWDFWFVDEFQDTSPLQKKLLFTFFRQPWNAYFVGDPQQSIYLFRGADENVFQETKGMVAESGGALERLKVNYRSHPDLLAFMNHLFLNMNQPLEPLEARGVREDSVRAQIHLAVGDVSEESLVLEQIARWKKQGYLFHEMCVLVKTNDKARLMARSLGAAGVPVYIHSSGGYYDRREVLDALALLSFIEDPSDDDIFVVLARSPWMAVPDPVLAEWGRARKKKSFWDWLGENDEQFEKVPTLKRLKTAVKKAETRPLSLVFETLVEELGFLEFCLMGDASGRREANLRKFIWALKRAEKRAGFSAAQFIENAWRELTDEGEESEAASFVEPQRVNIMTIHMSKGLKFNCVIIPHAGQALQPKTTLLEMAPDGQWAMRVLAIEAEEKVSPLMHVMLKEGRVEREVAESDRVFYVAVTRAAEQLALIASASNLAGPDAALKSAEKAFGKTGSSTNNRKIEDKSWLSHCRLNLNEGLYENLYQVTHWLTPPENQKIGENTADDEVKIARNFKLPVVSELPVTQLNVTRLVQERFLEKEIEKPREIRGRTAASFEFHLETQQRGQAIHSIFEEYKFNPQLGVKKLCEIARRQFPARLKIDDHLIERTLNLKHPPLKELIIQGHTEWPFIFVEKDLTLEGQVDLWGEVNGEVWIIDYKSAESFTPEALAKAHEQLELYALAVSKLEYAWDKIKIAVIAPLQKENVRLLGLSKREEVLARLVPLKARSWID